MLVSKNPMANTAQLNSFNISISFQPVTNSETVKVFVNSISLLIKLKNFTSIVVAVIAADL